jgi:hypothetical protein
MQPDDPQRGIVQQHLALAYEADGQYASAREVVDRALEELEERQRLGAGEGGPPAEPAWAADLRDLRDRLNVASES